MVAAVTRRIQRQVREKRDAVQAEIARISMKKGKEGQGLAPLAIEAKEGAERKMDKYLYFTDYGIEVDQEEGPVDQMKAHVVHSFKMNLFQ